MAKVENLFARLEKLGVTFPDPSVSMPEGADAGALPEDEELARLVAAELGLSPDGE